MAAQSEHLLAIKVGTSARPRERWKKLRFRAAVYLFERVLYGLGFERVIYRESNCTRNAEGYVSVRLGHCGVTILYAHVAHVGAPATHA
jgi:hypothetical protein